MLSWSSWTRRGLRLLSCSPFKRFTASSSSTTQLPPSGPPSKPHKHRPGLLLLFFLALFVFLILEPPLDPWDAASSQLRATPRHDLQDPGTGRDLQTSPLRPVIHDGHKYLKTHLSGMNTTFLYGQDSGSMDSKFPQQNASSASITKKTSFLVFSISSFPARSEHLPAVLEHILKQSRVPDLILIHYPQKINRIQQDSKKAKKNSEALFNWWEACPSKERIHIDTEAQDYGPATKLIGALHRIQDPSALIMIGDDDVLLHDFVVEVAEKSFYQRSGRNSITFSCEEWNPWKAFLSFLGVDEIDYITGGHQRGSRVCQGFGSAYRTILFHRSWFNNWTHPLSTSLEDYKNIPKECQIHDDVYISGILQAQKGILPYLVDLDSVKKHYSWNEYSIFKVPGSNPKYRNPCIKFFNYFGILAN